MKNILCKHELRSSVSQCDNSETVHPIRNPGYFPIHGIIPCTLGISASFHCKSINCRTGNFTAINFNVYTLERAIVIWEITETWLTSAILKRLSQSSIINCPRCTPVESWFLRASFPGILSQSAE